MSRRQQDQNEYEFAQDDNKKMQDLMLDDDTGNDIDRKFQNEEE